jgi:hypothetical protein
MGSFLKIGEGLGHIALGFLVGFAGQGDSERKEPKNPGSV